MDTIVERFVERKGLKEKYPNLKIDSTNYRDCIYIEDPLLLFRFSGELKHKLGNPKKAYNIFFRGQTNDYPQFVPRIFRRISGSKNNLKSRLDAYRELTSNLYHKTRQSRFENEIGGAVLQHYGIRTPWIDLVDNLFIAIWFATMERSELEPYFYERSKQDYGFIYFIQVETPSNSANQEIVEGRLTRWCDLRRTTNSLSLRPHNQGGIFFSKKGIDETNFDISEFIKAIVKIPIKEIKEWKKFLTNLEYLYSMDFMFPNTINDNTYKSLGSSKITSYIKYIEKRYKLVENELGKIDRYK